MLLLLTTAAARRGRCCLCVQVTGRFHVISDERLPRDETTSFMSGSEFTVVSSSVLADTSWSILCSSFVFAFLWLAHADFVGRARVCAC